MVQKYIRRFISSRYFLGEIIGMVLLFLGFAPMMTVVEAQTPPLPRRVNIRHFDENVSWARSALFWFGENEVSLPGKNYTDVRTAYTDNGLQIRVTVVDYFLWYNTNATSSDDLTQYDAVTIYIDTAPNASTTPQINSYQFLIAARHWQDMDNYVRQARGTGSGWDINWIPSNAWTAYSTMSWGCNPGPNNNDCSVDFGWTAFFTIPWSTFGLSAPPAESTVWHYAVQLYDRDNQPPAGAVAPEYWPETFTENNPSTWAELHFGYADYQPVPTSPQGTTVIRAASPTDNTVEDSWMGGGGWCNSGQEGDKQGSETNHGNDSELFVGNETAETNFPCFNKSYLRFSLDDIPAGKKIISANLTLHLWGNANEELAQPSWIHLFSIKDPWTESGITWNNAPLAQENIAVTKVDPLRSFPGWPGIPYNWDATQAVAEAYADGEPVNLALYSSDSAEHSSKYFTASEAGDWDAVGRPTLTIVWGSANPLSITPAAQAIAPGRETSYTLHIDPAADFGSTVDISVSPPSSDLQLSLSDTTVSPPADVILTVTDTHPAGSLSSGEWYKLTLTGSSGSNSYNTTADLLVGGTRVYLPLVLR